MRLPISILCFFLLIGLLLPACKQLVEDVNDNPNQFAAAEIEAQQFLSGAQLANVSLQAGHLQRIAALWTGQLEGMNGTYQNLYEYRYADTEADASWAHAYYGVLAQVRLIQDKLTSRPLYTGIAKVLEAHAIGTTASLFGDIPYSEAADERVDFPIFDDQESVFESLQVLLDDAIADLESAPDALVSQDLYFRGDRNRWIAAAWTLKARFFLLSRQYDKAYTSALNGISEPEGTMRFVPGEGDGNEDKNLTYSLLAGTQAGTLGSGNAFLMQLLDAQQASSRNHSKTNESARRRYLTVFAEEADENLGVAAATEPMPLVSYAENLLILAESGARTISMVQGLQALNQLRTYLRSGLAFRQLDAGDELIYENLTIEDFVPGAIENPDEIDMDRALLREIVEERFVSGFGQWMPFDDARRLRKDDSDIMVSIPLNTSTALQHPERISYPAIEIRSNVHAPTDPGLFSPTPINE